MFDEIEKKYNFRIPDDYKSMHSRGFFSLEKPAHAYDLLDSKYVWVNEMEWLSLDEILNYEKDEWSKDGFVPFAFNGAGEKWCWYPEYKSGNDVPIVLLPDGDTGEFYAQNFTQSLFRQIIDFISFSIDEDDFEEQIKYLRKWSSVFKEYFRDEWILEISKILQESSQNFEALEANIESDYCDKMVNKFLDFDKLDEEFEWTIN